MVRKVVKTINKTFVNYGSESKTELKELSKLNIMACNGRTKQQKVFISINKSEIVEVRVYDLSNYSINTYNRFNREIKKLVR